MGWSEALGQVMQTRPLLAYGASYLGGVVATASPCILASIPLVIGFVGGYAGGSKKQAPAAEKTSTERGPCMTLLRKVEA
jgi:cytochrome c biogenesis protein CcdA